MIKLQLRVAMVGIWAVLFVALPITLVRGNNLYQCQSQLDDLCEAYSLLSGDPGECTCMIDDIDASITTMLCTAPKGCQQCLDTNTNVCYETGQWKLFNQSLASRGDYYCFETGLNRVCTYFSGPFCRIAVDGVSCLSCQENEDSGLYTADCTNIVSTAELTFADPLHHNQTANSSWVGDDVFGPLARIFNGPGTPTCRVAAVKVDDVCGTIETDDTMTSSGSLNCPWKNVAGGLLLGLTSLLLAHTAA